MMAELSLSRSKRIINATLAKGKALGLKGEKNMLGMKSIPEILKKDAEEIS